MENATGVGETRRSFLIKGGALAGAAVLAGPVTFLACAEKKEAVEVTPPEDLMREHGVLRRLMLIYDDIGGRLRGDKEFPGPVMVAANGVIRRFIQDYHEKDEEEFLFPRFEKAGKLVDLVRVLREQHQAGRKLMDALNSRLAAGPPQTEADRVVLATYLQAFTRMYRPHAAQEDTVLYPALRAVVSPREFAEMGDKFEDKEQKLFGKGGFEKIVEEVSGLEKTLGIYDLSQFTPTG
jgi:hemerythrin-like domain-containing protein